MYRTSLALGLSMRDPTLSHTRLQSDRSLFKMMAGGVKVVVFF